MRDREILAGFSERMKNIAVFKPLFDLEQKRKYDYPLLELALVVLLFILEKMLKNQDSTYKDIALFLQEIIRDYYGDDLDYKQAKELTDYLVRECLFNRGKKHKFAYKNYQQQEEKEYKFDLLKLKDYEIGEEVVKLELAPLGLELLFKTKEMYSELQVSISQLYLKQQIQKGVFDGALRSIKELKLAVKNEKQRLKKLREKIIRDVLQVAREGAYREELKRINQQLKREQDTFEELMQLVVETLDKYSNNKQKEINKVMNLKNRLIETTNLHESLLTTKLKLENLMNKSMENMILNTFSTTVNFETEILEKVVNNDSSLEQIKQVVEPLFSANIKANFNLNRVFEPQNLYHQVEREEEELQSLAEDKLREKEREELKAKRKKMAEYKRWLLLLLKPLLTKKEIRLKEIINNLKARDKQEYQKLITNLNFYPFILNLHQLDTIPLLTEKDLGGILIDDLFGVLATLVAENEQLQKLDYFELLATDDVIKLTIGYVLSDFIIRRGQDGK